MVFVFIAAFATDFSEPWPGRSSFSNCIHLLSTQFWYASSGSNETAATRTTHLYFLVVWKVQMATITLGSLCRNSADSTARRSPLEHYQKDLQHLDSLAQKLFHPRGSPLYKRRKQRGRLTKSIHSSRAQFLMSLHAAFASVLHESTTDNVRCTNPAHDLGSLSSHALYCRAILALAIWLLAPFGKTELSHQSTPSGHLGM